MQITVPKQREEAHNTWKNERAKLRDVAKKIMSKTVKNKMRLEADMRRKWEGSENELEKL